MDRSVLRNELFAKATIIGCVMLAFDVAKLSLICYGGISWALLLLIILPVSLAVCGYLSYRSTRRYAGLIVSMRKQAPFFTYGEGLLYVTNLSMLAGVIVGLGEYLYMHYVIGYENFISAYIKLFEDAASLVKLPANELAMLREQLAETFAEMQKMEEPTLLSNIIGAVWSYLILGTVVGLVVAAFTKRRPQLPNEVENVENNENKPEDEQ